MNKLIHYIQNFLLVGLPFLIVIIGMTSFNFQNTFFNKLIHSHFGIYIMSGLMIWFTVLFLFLLILVLIPTAREKTLKRLANLQERDEREEYITGKAARTSYISTLSLIIFILFLSIFNVSLYKNPQEKIDSPHYTFSMGFHYDFFNKQDSNQSRKGTPVFDSNNIIPSTSTILIILLGWQLLAFNVSARREKKINT